MPSTSLGFIRRPLLAFLLPLALTGAAQAGPAPASEASDIYHRYRQVMTRYLLDAQEADVRVVRLLQETGTDSAGTALDIDTLMGNMYGPRPMQKRLVAQKEYLEKAWQDLGKKEISLERFLSRADWAMDQASGLICSIQLRESEFRTWLIEQKQRRKSNVAHERFRAEETRLKAARKNDDKALAAALTALRAEYTEQERKFREEAITQHQADGLQLMERRRELVGHLWRLQDFNARRGRTETARLMTDHAYGWWEVDLEKKGIVTSVGGGLDGSVLQTNHAYQCDWVQFGFWFLPDGPKELEWDALVRTETVDSLRQYDTALPAIRSEGTNLEMFCTLLAGRLERAFEVEKQLDQLYAALGERTRAVRNLPAAASLPSPAELLAAHKVWDDLKYAYDQAAPLHARRLEERDRCKRAADGARVDHEAARGLVYLDKKMQPVRAGAARALLAEDLAGRKSAQIAATRQTLEDRDLPPQQRKATVEVMLPRLEGELQAIEAAVTKAVEKEFKAIATANAQLAAAQTALEAAPAPDRAPLERAWAELRAAAAKARRAVPENRRAMMPDIPEAMDAESAKAAGEATAGLIRLLAAVESERTRASAALQQAISDIDRAQAEAADLAKAILPLRASAPNLAADALVALGAKPDDGSVAELRAMSETLTTTKNLVEAPSLVADGANEIGKLLQHGHGMREALDRNQKRMTALSAALILAKLSVDRINATEQAAVNLNNPATAAQAFCKTVGTAKDVAGLGGILSTVGATYFADTFTACVQAGINLQAKLVAQDFEVLVKKLPPELHLYTEAEVIRGSMRASGDEACRKIARMCQVRRLLALLKATELRQVRER